MPNDENEMNKFDLDFLQKELSRVSDWVTFSNRNSVFILGVYLGVLSYLVSNNNSILEQLFNLQNFWLLGYFFLLIGAFVFWLLGIYHTLRSFFPRLNNISTDRSLFYFGHVSQIKPIDYIKAFEKMTITDAKKQILEQIHTNSVIADAKMKNVQVSIKSIIILSSFLALLFLMTN